jgi:hypothetical protein
MRSSSTWRRGLLLAAFAGLVALGSGAGCSASVGFREPVYYQSRGYPVRVVSPGVRAYYINNGWYVHNGRRWRRHDVVVRGGVIVR